METGELQALLEGKGRYVLVDLQRRVPVELLPDREAETLHQWLQSHPGVEIVSRDRAPKYAVPFLQNKPLSAADTLRSLFSSVRERLRASLRVRQQNKQ